MRVLLIDDDFISIFLTKKLLQQEGVADSITCFRSSQDALDCVRQMLPEQMPDIIFLDLNMPVMSGWDFLEALKAEEQKFIGRCRIYILTSSLAPCDTARSKEFNLVAGLIHKPLDVMEIQAIRSYLVESSR
ncbi:response regulator [Hymenobacter sp. HMF4947]|uniref:Response regulator n=1 Tax=Hymenobacter ginkgonis TaxID=2682976 RepID=A0A7K1TA90_9BACT|nr:response regulator [Hymenobacter ginkgonis]MVN75310.1 response regulator [Hymenobacter ginkgonis]